MKYTVVFNVSTLEIKDVFEGNVTFGAFASGLDSGMIDADVAPAIGSTLAALPSDAATRMQLKTRLAELVAALNAAYNGLNLELTDSLPTASAKMLAAGVTWNETYQLKTIYETLNSL